MRHLSLCTGYGGIDMALAEAFGAETVAVADIDPGACKILAHRYPDVPNLGDITAADWSQWVGKVDVISGGTPCQDLSHAGRRAGMTEGTRSNLWVAMREAIAIIRPPLVCWENVRGAYSACADSELGRCPRCVDPDSDVGRAPYLRALGRVLGDLSSLGYDACWYGLRASAVGAAHHRYRVFVFAWPADAEGDTWRIIYGDNRTPATNSDAVGGRLTGRASDSQRRPQLGAPTARSSEVPGRVMPTPAVANRDNRSMSPGAALRPGLESLVAMLPTPDAYEGSRGGSQHPDKRKAGGHSPYLASVVEHVLPTIKASNNENRSSDWANGPNIGEALRSLPTPRTGDGTKGGPNQRGSSGDLMLPSAVQDWREYEPAIRRQEQAFGRLAPLPTEPGLNGKPRLSARFSEWLMGCPDGWITDVPGITRNEALKAAGNGVVPQQCAAAATRFVHDFTQLQERAA